MPAPWSVEFIRFVLHDAVPLLEVSVLSTSIETVLGEHFTNSLSKSDSDNLELISQRLIAVQEAAGPGYQLVVNMPLRGRVVSFSRPAQVEPDADMYVGFSADPVKPPDNGSAWSRGIGLF